MSLSGYCGRELDNSFDQLSDIYDFYFLVLENSIFEKILSENSIISKIS